VKSGQAAPTAYEVTFSVPTGARVVVVVKEGAFVTVGSGAPATVVLDARDPEIQPVHLRLAVTDRGLEAFSEAASRFSIAGQKRLRSPLADGDLMKIGATTVRIGLRALAGASPAPTASQGTATAAAAAAASAAAPPPPPPPPPPPAVRPPAPPASRPSMPAPGANTIAASLSAAVQSRGAPTRPAAPGVPPPQPQPQPQLQPQPAGASPVPPPPPPAPMRSGRSGPIVVLDAQPPSSRGVPASAQPTPAPAAPTGPPDPWTEDILTLFAAPVAHAPGTGGARKWRAGKGKAKKKEDTSADPLTRLVSAKAAAAAAETELRDAESAAPADGKRHLLTATALRHALEGAPALLASVPGDDLLHLLLYLESRRATAILEALGHDGDRSHEGRIPLREGALALPLVGDPLAPVLAWLVPLLALPRIEVRVTYAVPAPLAAEAAIQVAALLEELDRSTT